MPNVFYLPQYQALSSSGTPLAGAKLYFFNTATTIAASVYSSAARTTALANPVVADAQGRFPQIYPDPDRIYRARLTDSANVQQWQEDGVSLQLFLRTRAEIDAEVTPANFAHASGPYRYGAVGDSNADDTDAWKKLVKVNGAHFVPDGTYKITAKVQSSAFISVIGATRQNTTLTSPGFNDYLLEIGNNPAGPNPNVGKLERLKFFGLGAGIKGCLHMNQLSHMWQLNELLFQSSPCAALIVDNCWDSNYTNIDTLSCGNGNGDPANNATCIVKNGSNNIYFRGLRLEHCPSGALYVGPGCLDISVQTGKIDQGFISGQVVSAVTVEANSSLRMDEFTLTGINQLFVFDVQGSLALGSVAVDGGTGALAHIYDHRGWAHHNPVTFPNISTAACGPIIGRLDLGNASFARTHPSVNQTTDAAVYSKIFPIRHIQNCSVTSAGSVAGNNRFIDTTLTASTNEQFNGLYLVHNSNGYLPSSRRKIIRSYSNGQIEIAGTAAPAVDGDYSVEYSGGHYTPQFNAQSVLLDGGVDLFRVVSSGVSVTTGFSYISTPAAPNYGLTFFAINGPNLAPGMDIRGFFFIDETDGTPYYIGYGIDAGSAIGLMYNVVSQLNPAHKFSIVAGYSAGVRVEGAQAVWTFGGAQKNVPLSTLRAQGFDLANVPLWGGF